MLSLMVYLTSEKLFEVEPEPAAKNYVKNLYLKSDYKSMNGDLLALSSVYRELDTVDQGLFVKYDTPGK